MTDPSHTDKAPEDREIGEVLNDLSTAIERLLDDAKEEGVPEEVLMRHLRILVDWWDSDNA
jgi:hypothetical protein